MNLQHQRIEHACVSLKLDTLASEWAAIADHSASNEGTLADFLEQLLHLKLNARLHRSREALLKFAGFPGRKIFEDYDFKFASGAPRKQLNELTNMAFVERAENVVLLGPSVVGKSHLAISLGHKAVSQRIKTRFIAAADMMLQLAIARKQERLDQYLKRSVHTWCSLILYSGSLFTNFSALNYLLRSTRQLSVCCPEVTNSLITCSFQCDSLWINVFHCAVTQRESNGLIRFVG
jgi:DNA replication protein DnaC